MTTAQAREGREERKRDKARERRRSATATVLPILLPAALELGMHHRPLNASRIQTLNLRAPKFRAPKYISAVRGVYHYPFMDNFFRVWSASFLLWWFEACFDLFFYFYFYFLEKSWTSSPRYLLPSLLLQISEIIFPNLF